MGESNRRNEAGKMPGAENERVARLRAEMEREGFDALIVRDVNDLRWVTGFIGVFDSEEAHVALITERECIIHTDSRYAAALRAAAAIDNLWEVDDRPEAASAFVKRALDVRGMSAARIRIDQNIPLVFFRKLQEALSQASFVEGESVILGLRAVKDASEIELMRAAQRIADAAFLDLLGDMRVGMSEREAALVFEFATRKRGADGLSFPTIVASGPNGALPHAQPSERTFALGDLVVFDFGVQKNGYCSDTTRMVCFGNPAPEQRRAYEAVRAAHERVAARIHVGVTGKSMHEMAEEALAEAGFAGKMGHGLGHGVGLQIHESPNLNLRNDRPLTAGSVITIEPGVYLEGEFGIRLEDCGVLTHTGFESFCQLSHELFIVE